MEFLQNFFLPPSSDHLHLVKYLILLIYFIHIPFISLLLGGIFFSVFFRLMAGKDQNSLYWRVSRDFIDILVFRKTAGVILGVLPLLVLAGIEGQVFYNTQISVVSFMLYTTFLVAVGISLVYFYQYTFQFAEVNPGLQLSSGILALMFLLSGYFIFSVNSALVLDPGRWAVVTHPMKFLFSWNVIARFNHFLTAAFAVSGVALVFFSVNWKESARNFEPDYSKYLQTLGTGIGLGFILLQPVMIFWNLITLPDVALSGVIFAYTALGLFLIMIIALLLYRMLKDSRYQLGTNVFVLLILLLILMIVNDHTARESAIQNHSQLLITRANEVEAARTSRREALMATAIEPDLAVGEQVFVKQCTACHRYDQRVVGPPYDSVLPKYENNRENLAEFIRNPKKIDPDYPAMPRLGLSEKEIKSVVAYLFQELEKSR